MPSILQDVNWIDILFLILLLGMIYKGSKTGVGGQVVSLVGGFALVFVSVKYYSLASEALFGFLLQKWSKPASFLAIIVIIFIIIKVLERIMIVISGDEVASIERVGGVLVAALRAAMFCGLVGMFLLLIPADYIQKSVTSSKSCMFFVKFDAQVYCLLNGLTGVPKEKKQTKDDVVQEFMDVTKRAYE